MKYVVLSLMLTFTTTPAFKLKAQKKQTLNQLTAKDAKDILNTLAYYFGHDGIIPELKITQKLKQPAFYTNYQKPQILLDEKMFAISHSFGKDASVVMAFVLGHEMAHHYLKHSPGDVDDIKTYEKDADKWGCFYSHVAGYKVSPKLYARLLDKIYEVYKLNDHIPHYPSKAERKKLGLQKVKEIQDFNLGEVFNSAKFLFVMGKLEKSIECLEFIFNKHFKSAEMCNNLAVSYLRKIAQVKPLYQRVFLFPFEFDGNTSLRSIASGSANLPRLFEKSELLLRKALSIRKNYETAYLNLACLQIMKKKFGSAVETLHELKVKNKQLSNNAHALLALAHAFQNQHKKAQKHFQQAMTDSSNYIVKCNYKIYKLLASSKGQKFSEKLQEMKEYEIADLIENVKKECLCSSSEPAVLNKATQVFGSADQITLGKTVINIRPYFEIKAGKNALPSGYHYLKIKLKKREQTENLETYEVCFTPKNNHHLRLKEIQLGDSVKKLVSTLQQPNFLLSNFYIYKNHHLIVETRKNRIIGWMIYRKIE